MHSNYILMADRCNFSNFIRNRKHLSYICRMYIYTQILLAALEAKETITLHCHLFICKIYLLLPCSRHEDNCPPS